MKPWMRVVLVLLIMQGAASLVYFDRSPPPPTAFSVQRLTTAQLAPPLLLERRSGELTGDGTGRWRLVHFWATWCPPCKRELPGVLALARTSTALDVLPVAVDPAWAEVDRFFDGKVPPEVLRLRNDDALARFGAATLPDSYLVSPEGVLVARIAGERVWDGPQARAALAGVVDADRKSGPKEINP
jgi:thiol-disulfide isomerase/thioredoxin